ncbi:MAG: homoserine dehydrogenase [Rhodospirillales bacterium]
MTGPLRIGVAGLGTVGGGVLSLLKENADLISARAGRPLEVVAVSARDPNKARSLPLEGIAWAASAPALAEDPAVDVVVELIGGDSGPALDLVEASLRAAKPVVTANKALIARQGAALDEVAAQAGVTLAYEAAVAGGIPIIKLLREGLAANAVSRVYGILNGTCNYILSQMRESGRGFDEVLAEAQALGYAEADPTFDIDGIDAAHKLAILASLAFGTKVDFDAVSVEGIRHVSALDIAFAEELGYRIKLLGLAEQRDGRLDQRVFPCMVRRDAPIAKVEGVFNAVVAEGNHVGTVMVEGPGAGAGPTASAVVADLIDIARGNGLATFGLAPAGLRTLPRQPVEDRHGAFYLRLAVIDRPGVIADVAAILRDLEVSLESLLQRGRAPEGTVPVVMTTHEADAGALDAALTRIAALEAVIEPPRLLAIAEF